MINIALPKGRLGEKAYGIFEQAGFECPSIHEESRKSVIDEYVNHRYWYKIHEKPTETYFLRVFFLFDIFILFIFYGIIFIDFVSSMKTKHKQ